MPSPYDALIVGAGPAGCAAAYDLAHAGRRVLLIDKRTFPRGKACACGLTRKTLAALRYSVAPVIERECRDVVLQEAGPAFHHGRRTADKAAEVRVRLRQPFCAMAVRERFDAFCLEQTLAAGATFLRIEAILALRELPTHVELDVTLPGGATETLTAPVLVGADGSNGQTRRLSTQPTAATTAQLPPEPTWYARGFALEATVPYTALPASLPAGDAPQDLVFDFAPIAGGYGWLFPKGDHINIGVGGFVPQKPSSLATEEPTATGDPGMFYEAVTRDLLNRYTREKLGVALETLTAQPGVHVSGQHLGLGGHAYIPKGRILLTGDAAGLVDPLTGEGIHSALTSGQAAAAAILEVQSSSSDTTKPIATALSPRPEQTTSDSSAQPEQTTFYSSSRPEQTTSYPSAPPEQTTFHSSAQPEQTTPYPSAQPEQTTFHSSSRPERSGVERPAVPQREGQRHEPDIQANAYAEAYNRHLQPLRDTLTFSQRAARSFYREPGRGFKVMRTPLLRNLVLKTYADGLPTTKLLASLARRVA